jgi:hypothetical protein
MAVTAERFVAFSEAMLGESQLDHELAAQYLERLKGVPEAAVLDELIATFEEIVVAGGGDEAIKEQILNRDDLRELVAVILLLWYLGEIHGSVPSGGHPEHYFQGLFWNVIRAHPPALSGGYSGYWAYPPDN